MYPVHIFPPFVSTVNTNTIPWWKSWSPKSSLFSIVFLWKFFTSYSNPPTPVAPPPTPRAHLTFHHLFTLRIFCKDFRILNFRLPVIPLLASLRLSQVHTSPSAPLLTKFCHQQTQNLPCSYWTARNITAFTKFNINTDVKPDGAALQKLWTDQQQSCNQFAPQSISVTNLLKPNDIYICRTAALTSRRYILNIYSTNIHTEYFKRAA